ncbi:MAG: hypothetical protein JJU36_01340 [Phycisphaeraceae bacterium]|nr:hypothetical protein [Phycisphaeraceae bacterium]
MIRNCRLMIFALVLTAIGAASAHGQAPLPLERYFDGSLHGEGGEAFIDRDFPGYYHFTIESLGELERLEQLSFTVVTRQSHAANGHHISVVTAAAGEDDEKLLPLDVYDPDDGSDEAAQAGVESFFIGGGVGTTRHVKVDLSHLKDVEGRRLRIRFDEPRMRSRTALTRLELAGRLRGEAEMVTVAAYRFEDEADRAAPSDRRHGVRVGRLLPQRYPLAEPQHHRFTEYERYVLTLTGALPGGATLILHLGHQHGAFRQAWAETEGVWSLAKAVDASRLKLEAGRLTGTVEVDTGRVPASVDAPGDFPGVIATYRLDIDIKEGKPAGTFQGQWAWRVGNRVTWPEGKLVLEDEDVKWVTRDETEVSGEVSGRANACRPGA